MANKRRLEQVVSKSFAKKQNITHSYAGILGCLINGKQVVQVPYRPGYVYVRVRDNISEVLQAYNTVVSATYGLPVVVTRDASNNRYVVERRDVGRYENWITSASYPTLHGNTHSRDPNFPGADIVWVYGNQFMPLLAYPSGTSGADGVLVYPAVVSPLSSGSSWQYVGGYLGNLLTYKPTDNQAKMVLIYANTSGTLVAREGSTFAASLSGTSDILPYLPSLNVTEIPIAGIKLLSGTSAILWENIYDLRSFFL